MTDQSTVRVRIAPSPTGYFHLGGARSALFNWLYARHTGGRFVLRIEDTDRSRFVPESVEDMMASLRWLGLDWDEGPAVGGPYGPYFQSERLPLYRQWTDWLVDNGHAYHCYCSEERLDALRKEQSAQKRTIGYDRHCRYLSAEQRAAHEAAGEPYVIRFAMPTEGATTFNDLIRGPITVENARVLDPVLLKSDGFPTYHLANVVDDHFMEITHILRGTEWLDSVPLHVNLYRAFGWEMPVMAHLPLILDPSGIGKLSKRKKRAEGDAEVLTFVREYRAAGYLPEAMVNFLALMGWSYSPDTDLFTREQAVERFELKDLNPAAGALPVSKLEWMNGHYIRELSASDLTERLVPFLAADLGWSEEAVRKHPALPLIVPLVRERLKTLDDAGELVDFAFVDEIDYDPSKLVQKGMDPVGALTALEAAIRRLGELQFDAEAMELPMRQLADELGLKAGQLFGLLRVAVTGKDVAPPLFGSIVATGRERTFRRLTRAQELLRAMIAES